MVLCTLLFQLNEDAWVWLWFWDFLGWKISRKLSWLHFSQRSFVYCDVKGLLSSVPCQVEIRLECIVLPVVTLQAAADVISQGTYSWPESTNIPSAQAAWDTPGVGSDSHWKRNLQNLCTSFWTFLSVFFVSTGPETSPDSTALDNSFNEQESIQSQKSPLSESIDVKPSEMSLALPLPIGTEDHQMLLPVTGSQSPSSETLLRSAVTGYSEPQFIFLQQLYWQSSAEPSR